MFEDLSNPGHVNDGPKSDQILQRVKDQACEYFEQQHPDEAQLTFLGAPPLTLLRFSDDDAQTGEVTYFTLGCSAEPMHDPNEVVPAGLAVPTFQEPRAELLLTTRGGLDAVVKPLAMLAAAPTVEGLILQKDAIIDFAAPLWSDAPFTGFILAASEMPAVSLNDAIVTILRAVPATTNEIALARAKGVSSLTAKWTELGCDLADPYRASAV